MIRALIARDRERIVRWCFRRSLGACVVAADPARCEARRMLAMVAAAGWLGVAGLVARDAEGSGA